MVKIKSGKSIIMYAILLFSVLATTIVYSAFNMELQIKGEAVLRTKKDIRITSIKLMGYSGSAYETYAPKYTTDTTSIYVTLPANTYMEYEITITNKGNDNYVVSKIDELSHTNANVTYNVSLKENEEVIGTSQSSSATEKKFTIHISNNTKVQQEEILFLQYTFTEGRNLIDYIRHTLKNDNSTVIQDDETEGHNMRYIGPNPNNWISFNGELWRIIGVFGEDSHGQKEELIKIQYSANLGNIRWDNSNVNDWSKATLKTYLNEGEYYTINLNEEAKQMIQTVDWKLGAAPWQQTTMYADVFYNYERGSIGAKSNPTLTEWNGNVALSYLSDYIFSTNGGITHNRAECLTSPTRNTDSIINSLWRTDGANAGECATGSWMIQQARNTSTHPWTLMPLSDNTNSVFGITYNYSNGTISEPNANYTNRGVVPAVYLKSSIICKNCSDGTVGSQDNPYIIN